MRRVIACVLALSCSSTPPPAPGDALVLADSRGDEIAHDPTDQGCQSRRLILDEQPADGTLQMVANQQVIAVAWSCCAGLYRVFVRHFDTRSLEPLSTRVTITGPRNGSAWQQGLDIDQHNNTVVVWENQRALYAQYLAGAGRKRSWRRQISPPEDRVSGFAQQVAFFPNGDFVAAWDVLTEAEWRIHARVFTPDGRAKSPVVRAGLHGQSWNWMPDIAVAPDGSYFVLAWTGERSRQRAGLDREIFFQRFSRGGEPLGPATQVSDGPREKYRPSVAISGRRIAISWTALGQPSSAPYLRIYDSRGRPRSAAMEFRDRSARTSRVRPTPTGFAVGWSDNTEQSWIQYFDRDGRALGPVAVVDQPASDFRHDIAVTTSTEVVAGSIHRHGPVTAVLTPPSCRIRR